MMRFLHFLLVVNQIINSMCKEVKRWANAIERRNPKQMTSFYDRDAILLATYDSIVTGNRAIYGYFKSFLNKRNLTCQITEMEEQLDTQSNVKICSGLYVFMFTEQRKRKKVYARFSFVIMDGLIVNHHSSLDPE